MTSITTLGQLRDDCEVPFLGSFKGSGDFAVEVAFSGLGIGGG